MNYGRWNISGYDRQRAVELLRRGINPLIAVLLTSRGVEDSRIDELIGSPNGEICDPFLLTDMDRASERVKRALSDHEKIAVYGDYDVDGITASCLLADYLRSRGADCMIHIPERLGDGYGVKSHALKMLKDSGIDLVVTVDCGMSAYEECEYAKSLGLDVVITDHHECGGRQPEVPLVNPRREDCKYPSKSLAGVGVAFKLVCAVDGVENTEALLDRYADLVAIGTIADVMDVTGENRTIIHRGIMSARKGVRPGITALCKASGVDPRHMTAGTVGFTIAPRINAAGRIGDTTLAVNLISSKNEEEAAKYADELCELNMQRREIESMMFADALEMIESRGDDNGVIVISSEHWHQGIAGIIASRIAEKYRRPAIVICIKDGIGRGSCRSFGDFELLSSIMYASDLLVNFGGHKAAAGITVAEENIDALRDKLRDYYLDYVKSGEHTVYDVDFEVIKPGLLTIENVDSLKALEPFGNGNPQPLLCMMEAEAWGVMALSGGRHMKFRAKKNGESFECVCFGRSPEDIGVKNGDVVDIAFTPKINEFRGRKSVQLIITDIYIH